MSIFCLHHGLQWSRLISSVQVDRPGLVVKRLAASHYKAIRRVGGVAWEDITPIRCSLSLSLSPFSHFHLSFKKLSLSLSHLLSLSFTLFLSFSPLSLPFFLLLFVGDQCCVELPIHLFFKKLSLPPSKIFPSPRLFLFSLLPHSFFSLFHSFILVPSNSLFPSLSPEYSLSETRDVLSSLHSLLRKLYAKQFFVGVESEGGNGPEEEPPQITGLRPIKTRTKLFTEDVCPNWVFKYPKHNLIGIRGLILWS